MTTLLEIPLHDPPGTVLLLERLRDGRIALSVRHSGDAAAGEGGDLYLLDPKGSLALAAWLTPAVESAWEESLAAHQPDQLRTAEDLYGDGAGAVRRLAEETAREIPAGLLSRAMVLLANSIGPEARERLVGRLNQTLSPSEDGELRRRLAEEREAFAYALAAASLFHALEHVRFDEE